MKKLSHYIYSKEAFQCILVNSLSNFEPNNELSVNLPSAFKSVLHKLVSELAGNLEK